MRLAFILFLLPFPSLWGGVLADYQQGAVVDRHEVRMPALHVTAGEPATPLLQGGSFTVTWTGELVLEKRQRLYFSFEGRGQVTLSVNGAELLSEQGELGSVKSERLRLNSGAHPFSITYQSPADGDARFRLLWEERSFPVEPVPASAFVSTAEAPSNSELVYEGRRIFGEFYCAKCHLPEDGFGPHAMPELSHVPPILGLTGDRLKEGWVAAWIANPNAERATSRMPRLVPENEEGRQMAADLAAYLMELKTGTTAAFEVGSSTKGGALFHELACVTCHDLPSEPSSSSPDGRIPLAQVAGKFQSHALVDYLLDPAKLSPHTRMPNFALDETEASDLAAFLLETAKEEKSYDFPLGDVLRGEALVKDRHCGACHAGLAFDASQVPRFEQIAKQDWSSASCYQGSAHQINLPAGAGVALEALRSEHLDSLRQDTPEALATRQFQSLRCYACHSRDEESALLASLHTESLFLATPNSGEQMDQSLPALSHVGEMLHSDYLASMLSGEVENRPRPWLEARMPAFTNHSPAQMAEGFAAQHGLAPSIQPRANGSASLAKIGADLVGSETGLGCTTCHGVGASPPTAAFEVMGVNFSESRKRLRESFFFQWMHDPTRINASVKMPRYADESGQTALPVFEGDAQKQFEAIWSYLNSF